MRIKLLIAIMFIGIAIVITIGVLFRSSIIGSDSVDASSFGISPPYIKAVDLSPGDTFTQKIRVLRGGSNVEQKVMARFDDLEIADWFVVSPSETIIMEKGDKYASFNFELNVPEDAYTGEYQGRLYFAISSSGSGPGVFLTLGARADIAINIIDGKEKNDLLPLVAKLSPERLEDNKLADRLQGKFIMRSLSLGQIYYLHPVKKQIYYLGSSVDFLNLIKNEARGISNELLAKIPIFSLLDEDNNQISKTDLVFAKSLSGFLLLQVEDRGQLWYVNPVNNKRILLADIDSVLDILEKIALGISEENYQRLLEQ